MGAAGRLQGGRIDRTLASAKGGNRRCRLSLWSRLVEVPQPVVAGWVGVPVRTACDLRPFVFLSRLAVSASLSCVGLVCAQRLTYGSCSPEGQATACSFWVSAFIGAAIQPSEWEAVR
jgi:hypothetical protein